MAGKAQNINNKKIPDPRFHSFNDGFTTNESQTPPPSRTNFSVNQYVRSNRAIFSGAFGSLESNLTISTGIMDITQDSTGDIRVRRILHVNAETGTSDTLDAIECDGAELPYQELILIGATGDTITITHNFGSATGTQREILCPSDSNYTLNGDEFAILVYDYSLSKWILNGGGSGSGGLTEPVRQTVTAVTAQTEPTTTDVDVSVGNTYTVSVTKDITVDLTGTMPNSGEYQLLHIIFTQDSTGGWTVSWDAGISFTNGTPTISETADAITDVVLYTVDQGTTWTWTVSSGGFSGSFANQSLSNLSSPSLNTPIDFNSNAPTNFPGFTNAVGQALAVDGNGFTFDLPTSDSYLFRINGSDELDVSASSIDVHDKAINSFIGWVGAVGQGLTVDGSGATYDMPTGDQYLFRVNGSSVAAISGAGHSFDGGNVNVNSNKIVNVTDPTSAQDAATKAYVDSNGGDLWSDVVDSDIIPDTDSLRNIGSNDGVTPKQFAGIFTDVLRFDQNTVYLKKNITSGNLELYASSGDQIDFILGATTEWFISSSKLDGSSNTLRCGLVEFSQSVNHSIQADASGLEFYVPTSDSFEFKINSTDEMTLSSSELNIKGNDLTLDTSQQLTTDTGGIRYKVPTSDVHDFQINSSSEYSFSASQFTIADANNISVGTTTGTKIGTTSSQKIGFFGATPVVQRSAYTVTNHITDRTYDANSTSVAELADVLGTLIVDLRSLGLIAT